MIRRAMSMHLPPVVVVRVVADVRMYVDKPRRCRPDRERHAEQPDKQRDTPAFHKSTVILPDAVGGVKLARQPVVGQFDSGTA